MALLIGVVESTLIPGIKVLPSGHTKVHLTIVEQMDNGETSTGNIYSITDSENNFVGFQMIGNIEGGNITLEFISTTGAVEFPSDLDSYVEA